MDDAPLKHARRHLWIALICLAVLMLLALPFDQRAGHWLAKSGGAARYLRAFLLFPAPVGGYAIHLIVLGVLASAANRGKLLCGYFAAYGLGLVVTAIKYLVGRARPNADLGAWHFMPLTFSVKHMNSFPSGDASAAMILCALLGLYFPRSRPFFLLLAVWCALGRVAAGRHFPSDVFAGAAIGLACVLLTTRWLGPQAFRFGVARKTVA